MPAAPPEALGRAFTAAPVASLPAVASSRIVGIKSTVIPQRGPAALTDGLDAIRPALAQSLPSM